MDPDRFLRELPALFEDFPRSELPLDPRFAAILDTVEGLARPNNLALLNLAASLLDPGATMASVIANEFTEATGPVYLSALIQIALVLFAVTIVMNGLARLLVYWVTGGRRDTAGAA